MTRVLLSITVAMLLLLAPAASAQTPPEYGQVSAGLESCAVQTDGDLDCWGNVPDDKPKGGKWLQVAVSQHTCAIRADRKVDCWGVNNAGESNPVPASFTEITVGAYHTCGMTTDRELVCWGSQAQGERNPVPGQYVHVAAGSYHTCGLREDGEVVCWGLGTNRSGSNVECREQVCRTPWSLPAGKYKSVSAGNDFQCAIRADDTIACAGRDAGAPVLSPPAGTFTQVAAGDDSACAVRTDASVACWGGSGPDMTPPDGVAFRQVSTGGGVSCGITTASAVRCWGTDTYRLKDGPDYTAPVMSGLTAKPARFRAGREPDLFGGSRKFGTVLRFRLTEYVDFSLVVRRKNGVKVGTAKSFIAPNDSLNGGIVSTRWTGRLSSGRNTKIVRPGSYDVFLTPTDRAGNLGETVKVAVRVIR